MSTDQSPVGNFEFAHGQTPESSSSILKIHGDESPLVLSALNTAVHSERISVQREGNNVPGDTIQGYYDAISQVPLLNKDQEIDLAKRIEKGRAADDQLLQNKDTHDHSTLEQLKADQLDGQAAKEAFMRANLRLVVFIAKRYPCNPALDYIDLIQEGNIGLGHAIDKFDWRKGFRFSTYATIWIKQHIGYAISQKGSTIRISRDLSDKYTAYRRSMGNDIDGLQVQNEPDLPDEFKEIARLTHILPLDATIASYEETTYYEFLESNDPTPDQIIEQHAEKDSIVFFVRENMESIDRKTQEMMLMKYTANDNGRLMTYAEVATAHGITTEQARRIVEKGMRKLRSNLKNSKSILE